MARPNVLWICTDQQRWDTLSFLGHPGARTPNDRSARSGGDGVRPRLLPEPDLHAEPGVVPERQVSDRDRGAAQRERRLPGRHRAGAADIPGCRVPDRADRQAASVAGAGRSSRNDRRTTAMTNSTGATTRTPTGPEGHDYQDWLRSAGSTRRRSTIAAATIGPGSTPSTTRRPGRASGPSGSSRSMRGRPWFLSINLFDPHPPFDPPADYLARFDRAEMPGPVFAPSDLAHQERLFEVDQQARVAVDPRRGDPDSPLYEPPGARPEGATTNAARDLRRQAGARRLPRDDRADRRHGGRADGGPRRDRAAAGHDRAVHERPRRDARGPRTDLQGRALLRGAGARSDDLLLAGPGPDEGVSRRRWSSSWTSRRRCSRRSDCPRARACRASRSGRS